MVRPLTCFIKLLMHTGSWENTKKKHKSALPTSQIYIHLYTPNHEPFLLWHNIWHKIIKNKLWLEKNYLLTVKPNIWNVSDWLFKRNRAWKHTIRSSTCISHMWLHDVDFSILLSILWLMTILLIAGEPSVTKELTKIYLLNSLLSKLVTDVD